MLSNIFQFNMRSVLRFLFLAIVVFYLLDAGVEAGKSRKKRNKNRRSKRTQIERRERRRWRENRNGGDDMEELVDNNQPFPTLVELIKMQQTQEHKTKVERPILEDGHYDDISSSLVRKFMENRRKNEENIDLERVTVLPVVHAKVDFLIKREKSRYFYEPTSTISSITSAELGLVSVHSARGKYGLHSPSQRIFGRLIHISDAGRTNSHFGCGNAIANEKDIPQNNEPWIALIERGHCAFFTKIKLAERNNASAVIIYDHKGGEVPKMNTIGTNIVSVIINRHDGHKVARLADSGTKVLVNIDVNLNPDATTLPNIPTTLSSFTLLRDVGGGNGAKTHNGHIITTILTVLFAVFLQRMTS